MLKLPKWLAAITRIAARDPGRYALSNIRLRETDEGFEAQATDGRRLVIVTGPGRADDGAVPMLATAPNGETEGFISAADFKSAINTVAIKNRGEVFVALGSKVATFATVEKAIQVHRAAPEEIRWPNFKTVLPGTEPAVVFDMDAYLLADLLEVVAELGPKQSTRPTGLIRFRFWNKNVPVAVTAEYDGVKTFAMQMPCTSTPPTQYTPPTARAPEESEVAGG